MGGIISTINGLSTVPGKGILGIAKDTVLAVVVPCDFDALVTKEEFETRAQEIMDLAETFRDGIDLRPGDAYGLGHFTGHLLILLQRPQRRAVDTEVVSRVPKRILH